MKKNELNENLKFNASVNWDLFLLDWTDGMIEYKSQYEGIVFTTHNRPVFIKGSDTAFYIYSS